MTCLIYMTNFNNKYLLLKSDAALYNIPYFLQIFKMATQQKKSQNSLDNLMMAYTDLSSNSKGSSFKGPAMKDVKVQKAEGPSFKPSQKARDWSSLEQSLESAFSLQQQQQQQYHQPQVLPFQPQFPSMNTSGIPQQQQQQNQDEWGDFQEIQTVKKKEVVVAVHDQGDDDDEEEFSDFVAPSQMIGSRLASIQDESPVHNFKPKILAQQQNDRHNQHHSHQNWSQPSPVTDFADFQGLSLPSAPTNVLPVKVGNDVTNSISVEPMPKVIQNDVEEEEDDFGDFTGPPPPPPTGAHPVASSTISSNFHTTKPNIPTPDLFSDTIIPAAAVINTTTMTLTEPKPMVIDFTPSSVEPVQNSFADFTSMPSTNQTSSLSSSQISHQNQIVLGVLPKPKSPPKIISPPTFGAGPASPLKKPPQPTVSISTLKPSTPKTSNDKYSALRDIFSVDNDDDEGLDSVETVIKSPQPLEQNWNTLQIDSTTTVEDDDFGDFVTTTEDTNTLKLNSNFCAITTLSTGSSLLPDESLHGPSSNVNNKIEPADNFTKKFPTTALTTTTPKDKNKPFHQLNMEPAAFIPWHENSPPPPPEDIIVDEDNDDVLHTHGYSFSDDANIISEVLENNNKMPSLHLRSMSPTEADCNNEIILSDDNVLEALEFTSNHKINPKPMLHPVEMTNEDQKIQNLEEKQGCSIISYVEMKCKLLQGIFNVLNHALEIFDDINDNDIKNEVLSAKETENYVLNLIQVYRVFQRLQATTTTTTKNQESDEQQQHYEDIEKFNHKIDKVWKQFQTMIINHDAKSDLMPVDNAAIWDFSHCKTNASKICPICLLDLENWSREINPALTDSIINYKYHSICANFWINCVDPVLPK